MIGVILFTHGSIATSLRETAVSILGAAPHVEAIDLAPDADRASAWEALDQALRRVDHGDGVIIFVDMFGGTPSNLALAQLADHDAQVLTGVNLAMVIRAIRRRDALPLADLAADVLAYGRRNVTSSAGWLRSPAAGTKTEPSPS